jgi:hypothetical protein
VQDMLQETFSFRPVDCEAGAVGTNRRLPEDTHNIRLHIPAGSNIIHLNVQSVAESDVNTLPMPSITPTIRCSFLSGAGRMFFFPFSRGGPRTSAHTYAAALILISILVFRFLGDCQ